MSGSRYSVGFMCEVGGWCGPSASTEWCLRVHERTAKHVPEERCGPQGPGATVWGFVTQGDDATVCRCARRPISWGSFIDGVLVPRLGSQWQGAFCPGRGLGDAALGGSSAVIGPKAALGNSPALVLPPPRGLPCGAGRRSQEVLGEVRRRVSGGPGAVLRCPGRHLRASWGIPGVRKRQNRCF